MLFSIFEGSEVFKLSNIMGGARYQISSSKGIHGQSATDSADEIPGPGEQASGGIEPGEPMSSGGQWDNVTWTPNP